MLWAKFGWNWASGYWEEDENVKRLQTDGETDRRPDGRTDRRTDDGQQVIRKAHLSFQLGELKTDILHTGVCEMDMAYPWKKKQ